MPGYGENMRKNRERDECCDYEHKQHNALPDTPPLKIAACLFHSDKQECEKPQNEGDSKGNSQTRFEVAKRFDIHTHIANKAECQRCENSDNFAP